MSESELQRAFFLALPREIPTLRVFRRNVGVFRVQSKPGDPIRVVSFGIKGQCDLYGIFKGGLHIELELKAKCGVLSSKQKEWAEWCKRWNVPHLTLREDKGETTDSTVRRWCEEVQLWEA